MREESAQPNDPAAALTPPPAAASAGKGRAASARIMRFLTASPHRGWLFGVLIVASTVVAYLPALRGGFVWDDDSWTTNISGLLRDASGLRAIWCKTTAMQQYYPLTGTTFWLDFQLWGLRTLPYHVENVLIHAVAALLFWRLLRRLHVPGAWLASAIFALHPVMVESAAWITERKNVLSLVLYLGALLAYGRSTRFWEGANDAPGEAKNLAWKQWGTWALALALFAAALLAKTTTFSLPAVVLLLCWWKRGRIRWGTDVLPTLPFFGLAIGLSLVTAWLEKYHLNATGPEWSISFPGRCVISGRVFWFYIGKLLWPAGLCFVYPRWQPDPGQLRNWFHLLSAVGLIFVLCLARGRMGRGPVTALLYYVGTLFPLLGFLNAYGMRFSFVWDHWVYLPSLGLIALVAALAAGATARFRAPGLLFGFAVVLLPTLVLLTWRQGGMYKNMETLWRTTLARNPNSFMVHNNLGLLLFARGHVEEAVAHYRRALELEPNNCEAFNNLGNALFRQGKAEEAISQFRKALELRPGDAEVHDNFATVLLHQGREDEALAHYRKALETWPNDARAHGNLGSLLLQKGQPREAMAHYQAALQLQPTNALVLNNLAWLLATSPEASIRDGRRALDLAQQAQQSSGGTNPAILGTLAAAYAEVGQFAEAVMTARQALKLAENRANTAEVYALQANLKLYQAGSPCRDNTSTNAAKEPNPP
jgi:protein O-mannosyl-transferase